MYKTKDLIDRLLGGTMSAKNRAELVSDIGAAKAHLLVADNDAKQLLTNLSDGQEVEVTGEAGRIERYNGDNAGVLTPVRINHPVGTAVYPPNTLAIHNGTQDGKPTYTSADGTFSFYVQWSEFSSKWVMYTGGLDTEWESTDDVATPDLVTTWTAVSAEAIPLAPLTSAMVIAAPAATESNWSDILSSAYVSFHNSGLAMFADVVLDGVTYGDGTTTGIGWMREGQILEASSSAMMSNTAFAINAIDTVTAYPLKNNIPTSGIASGNTIRTAYLTLPPKARLVTITGVV
tara:strand:- start:1539 stop:2408 length:870 start_codon:yes stop_codon:yes gene_type:complete